MATELPSRSAVGRAGDALIEAYNRGLDLPADACDIVSRWRERHADPLTWLTTSLRGRIEMPASYRLKRLPQIVAKLARARNMNLARMQDVGGCRIVVNTHAEVDAAISAIQKRSTPWYEVIRTTDYRRDGRQTTGYRAVHVIVRRDECLLEIQIRTRRQHGWAEAVERAADRTGFRLKDGDGPSQLVEHFRFASDLLAELDDDRALSMESRTRFEAGEKAIATFLPDVPHDVASGFRVTSKSLSTRQNNWLLVYSKEEGRPIHWMDCGTDPVSAAQRYSEWEREYPWRNGYEVVLIGSDSRDTIEWTHAHYFGRSLDDIDPHGVLLELRAA